MKILHIESGRHLYGGPRQVILLIEGLRAAGHDNVLACPAGRTGVPSRSAAARVALEFGVRAMVDGNLAVYEALAGS